MVVQVAQGKPERNASGALGAHGIAHRTLCVHRRAQRDSCNFERGNSRSFTGTNGLSGHFGGEERQVGSAGAESEDEKANGPTCAKGVEAVPARRG
eukprot:3119665-Pleurochrysis_carterae.AAC.2